MRAMMFATVFPHYHPKKGMPTYFIQKVWANIHIIPKNREELTNIGKADPCKVFLAKFHTIRAGNRWKVGDLFIPRVWSGRPYNSKTIDFAEPIKVEKTWAIKFDECGVISVNGFYDYSEIVSSDGFIEILAKNDGLTGQDFHNWFPMPKPFDGQIICWNDIVNYDDPQPPQ